MPSSSTLKLQEKAKRKAAKLAQREAQAAQHKQARQADVHQTTQQLEALQLENRQRSEALQELKQSLEAEIAKKHQLVLELKKVCAACSL